MTEERRVVTVVFADVVGSTQLGEQLDAEDVRSLLATYYAIARDVVDAHGGTLEKFIGDAVMGVFGIPRAHGDDPDRALAAALELRDRVRSNPELSELRLRFGVCTGEVVASSQPGADFLVTGDAVNIAARLQQAAEPWAILAAERTVTALSADFVMGAPMAIEAKGKTAPIAAREIHSRTSPKAGDRRVPKAALRGRGDELEQLALVARRAFRDRKPAFLAIIAPAGTGKTRLLDEYIARELPRLAPDALVTVAQCLPYGKQLTYWPLRQVLFRLAALDDEASQDEVQRRLADWLDNATYGELLATSIGYGTGQPADKSEVFTAWRFALEKASKQRPLVLVFDDLQWSSDSLLDLVDRVMQMRGDTSLLVIALARPELMDRRPAWGGGRRNFTNLFLEPLSEADIRALVRDLLEGVSEETADAVVAQAAGNPFYAEELVRSIIATGRLDLPDTVQASIQARLDLLPPDERRVLQLGSVFGRVFSLAGVASLDPEREAALESLRETLLTRDMVRQGDDDTLGFSHVLIREVTYHTMTRAERSRLHAAAGSWLASRSAGVERPIAEVVAFHYGEAAALIGRTETEGEARALKDTAVDWLARAADFAAAAGAQLEASRHLRAAIELADDEQLPRLYERLGDVEQLRLGSIDAYARALELGRRQSFPAADELRVIGGLLMCVMRWAEGVGRFPAGQVAALVAEGKALLDSVDDQAARAKFLAAQAFYPWHLDREGNPVDPNLIGECEASARTAAELAEGVGDWNTWSAALDGITSCLIERYDWSASAATAQRRLDRQADLNVIERMDATHMVALSHLFLADLEAAADTLQRARGLLDTMQTPSLIQALIGDHMYPLLLLGRWDEAVEKGEHLLRVWAEAQEVIGPGRAGFLAGLRIARARRDAARVARFLQALYGVAMQNFPDSGMFVACADLDFGAMESQARESTKLGTSRMEMIEIVLSVLLDSGHRLADASLFAIEEAADRWRAPLLKAQILRAKGDFEGAARIWRDAGAAPFEARARIEQALADGHRPDPQAIGVLERIGDIDYLERHALSTSG